MTAFEIISILIGILTLLFTFGSFILTCLSIIIHIIVLLIFFHSFRHFPSFTSILLLFYYRFLLYIYSLFK